MENKRDQVAKINGDEIAEKRKIARRTLAAILVQLTVALQGVRSTRRDGDRGSACGTDAAHAPTPGRKTDRVAADMWPSVLTRHPKEPSPIMQDPYTSIQKKTKTIHATKQPHNRKTLRSFLSAVNAYKKFIPDHARLRKPLVNLLKRDVMWVWDDECQKAFTSLKESLTTYPTLHLYQEGLPCQVYCNASTLGIAGVLKQVYPDGKTYTVQNFSRALRAHERISVPPPVVTLAIAIIARLLPLLLLFWESIVSPHQWTSLGGLRGKAAGKSNGSLNLPKNDRRARAGHLPPPWTPPYPCRYCGGQHWHVQQTEPSLNELNESTISLNQHNLALTSGENVESYLQEVLLLCKQSNPGMSEGERRFRHSTPDLRDVIGCEVQQTLAPISAPRRRYLPYNDQGYRQRTDEPSNTKGLNGALKMTDRYASTVSALATLHVISETDVKLLRIPDLEKKQSISEDQERKFTPWANQEANYPKGDLETRRHIPTAEDSKPSEEPHNPLIAVPAARPVAAERKTRRRVLWR
ncbi:hypothetical protein LAZ67_X003135 [Cordylochernes scorpioides]|uniref:Reverse transcriptase/retrotransposon-derived protein RNase H-like domain-containing protein n=1 Tax=Cordylochernes scorpioides TaxID=51811 RepID=A0ABY6LUZ2_9ARAC|nr:hypothetical protein LAZ67_X003135 [Cordylochernes scorpioides]